MSKISDLMNYMRKLNELNDLNKSGPTEDVVVEPKASKLISPIVTSQVPTIATVPAAQLSQISQVSKLIINSESLVTTIQNSDGTMTSLQPLSILIDHNGTLLSLDSLLHIEAKGEVVIEESASKVRNFSLGRLRKAE